MRSEHADLHSVHPLLIRNLLNLVQAQFDLEHVFGDVQSFFNIVLRQAEELQRRKKKQKKKNTEEHRIQKKKKKKKKKTAWLLIK